MFIAIVILILLIAILISLVVLLQSGQGGGLAGIASGGQTQQILGARQAPDFLEKATWTLGGLFLLLCVIAPFTTGNQTAERSILQERGVQTETGVLPPAGLPAGPPVEAPQTAPVSPVQPGAQADMAPSSQTPTEPTPAPVQPAP